ncbi:MAG TPA: hypothetical protein VGC42_11230, partial [Kofleriaceae bacterium]
IDFTVALEHLVRLRARIADHPAWGAEHPRTQSHAAGAIIDDAVRGLSTYHTRPIVTRRDQTLQVDDVKLLYYYQNRTAHIPPEAA